MADYIKREEAKNAVTNHWLDSSRTLGEIMGIPSADVAPVVHGKWILDRRIAGGAYFKCSLCGRSIEVLGYSSIERFPYCHCGAKMDGI